MTYNEAFSKATEAKAYVKCTYVELFNKQGKKLFSLQKEHFDDLLGIATYDSTSTTQNSLVAISISDELYEFMQDYESICKTPPFASLKDGLVWVRKNAIKWTPIVKNAEVVEDDEEVKVVTKKESKTKSLLAVVIAAASLLFSK